MIMCLKLAFLFWILALVRCQMNEMNKRPFYVIAHMVNSIPEIKEFLDMGANVLESDISFFSNGSVEAVYHGNPCGECLRTICTRRAKLSDYLDYIREITDPSYNGSYQKQLVFQFFDMKLTDLKSPDKKRFAGQDIADHVLDHLWGRSYAKKKLVRVLLYINTIEDAPTLSGFQERFKERNVTDLLVNVGYDGGIRDNSLDIERTFQSLGIESNIWQGDGNINCLSSVYSDSRLKDELKIRNKPTGYIDKVYHWTIDDPGRMKKSLKLNVDGMITNVPKKLVDLVKESFTDNFRFATSEDDPFKKFVP